MKIKDITNNSSHSHERNDVNVEKKTKALGVFLWTLHHRTSGSSS